jgi:hypothetical protein
MRFPALPVIAAVLAVTVLPAAGLTTSTATYAATGTPAAASAASSTSGVALPNKDRFYRYTGKTPLRRIAPGTALRTRKVSLAVSSGKTLPAEQILYRTTDATGHAVVSVTTVALPATGTVDPKVVAYLSFYDALGDQCDPSYILRGGNPGSANQENSEIEQGVISALVADGYIAIDPDFEDESLDYVSGTESGMSSLDAIKATLSVLKLKQSTTPVNLMGYSGGSIAADWASELAPRYTPHLDLIGVTEGGVPVDLAHNLSYINGSPSWSDVIPAAMIGIARSNHLKLQPYLSSYGRKIVKTESHECIGQFLGRWPGLTVRKLLKRKYADVLQVPVFRRLFNHLIMGSAKGHPQEPLQMVAGNLDGTGDGVMVEKDEQALAYEYCHQHMTVDFIQLKNLSHDDAGVAWIPQALAFIASRFAGIAATDNCSSISRGNSLAPIKPEHHGKPKHQKH